MAPDSGHDRPSDADVLLPALLRTSRRTYGDEIRAAQLEVGCDDVPRNGSFVIGAIARFGSPLADIIRAMGISKQTASQLVDTLVVRGYLERSTDPSDRRRTTVTLTDRGWVAAQAGREAVDAVDEKLRARVGDEYIAHTKATLAALIDLQHEVGDEGSGHGGPADG